MFHDRTRDLLIYEGQLPDPAWLPEAKALNGHWFAVPRTLHNCQVLRYKEFPVPPVITDENYDWPRHPSIAHPYESQKLAANFMALHPRCFNLSDMGTGKTMSSLWAADWLMRENGDGFRALIVAPLSTLQRVWGDAIFRNFMGRRTYEVLHGSAEQRLAALAKLADFYIINCDGVGVGARTRHKFQLDGFSKRLFDRRDIRLCIVDEASAYKDSSTKRHRIARDVLGTRDYLWLLTGTPTPNAPTDAYGLAKLVNGARGRSFTGFRMETMYQLPSSTFKWFPKPDGYDKAKQLLSPAIRFDIRDVWDAPELTTQQREVPLSGAQKAMMADLKRDLEATVASGAVITAINEASVRTKFLQVAAGAVYDADHRAHGVDSSARIAELKDILEQCPRKVIIFASFTSVLDRLHRELKEYKFAIVNGAVSEKERSRIFSAFQDGDDLDGLLADPATMAHGLNLYRGRTGIWYTPTDKTELYQQANKRMHRPGQQFPVNIVQIVSTPLEREIFRRLETNASLQGALLDAVRKGDL
jgi:SNF2 family DNA or RNA helicase